LTIYSGRSEELVAPVIEQFTEATGIEAEVRYGDTAEQAATILEEGTNSPADVFFAQDAGALGAVAAEASTATLPQELLDRVDQRFRSPDGHWVGVSGRARVVVYSTERVQESDLPDSILDFTDPAWKGRLGWAPTNGSFQAFVTALRVTEGEEAARAWLEGIQENEPEVFEGNLPIVEAVAAGDIDAGFVNHYYLLGQLAEQGDDYPAANHFLSGGDPGALVNVAGVTILATTDQPSGANEFVDYLLSPEAQEYFATETYEYPLIEGVTPDPQLPPLAEIESPDIDLSDLQDLEGTLDLLADVGVL
jgi:iron(III) transport system substrate-binding protein